jgi:sec-independent protein translocase protein TatC
VDDRPLPLTAHLAELRSRLFRIVVAWVAGSVLSWNWREEIFATLLAPALGALGELGEGHVLQAIAPTEIFFTYLQCALLAGFALTLPVFFWQIWAFVAPGLYPQEKRVALPFVLVSTFLFASGAAFGYTVVFPVVFSFFANFSSEFVQAAWTMREVFGFTTRMLLAFGAGFELPVIVFFLALAGVVEPRRLLAGTKYFVLVAFIVGGVLTPPDPLSQSLLAGPLIVLYLLGVAAAYLFVPKRSGEPAAATLPTVLKR